jgi:phage gp29-like protein
MHLDPSLSERLFAELVLTAQAAERRLRPYVGELGADPMVFRSFGTFGRWQEIPHPSRFVRERSEDGDRVGELYTRMVETDANIAALWEKRVKAVLALPRTIRAADASPLAEEIAVFVHTALALIPLRVVPISNTLEAVLKGVAINEVLWERQTRGTLAGAWLPVDVIDRPMWRFGWSAKDRTLHVVPHPGRTEPVPAPPMKFQVLSYGTKDNPWGRALLDRLYWVWYLKRHASKFWSVFVERFAQPLVKGTYPFKADQDVANKANEDRLLAILNSIRTGSSIALPSGLDITFLEASRGGDASYLSFVSWLERAQGLLLLGEVDTSGLARGNGSFAKALISNEVRLETVQHDAHLLGSFESDTLIRWLVLLNYGSDAPIPKSVYDATDAADRSQRMRGISTALNDGVPVPLGYYRMTMRIPVPNENEPTVEARRQPIPPSPAGWEGTNQDQTKTLTATDEAQRPSPLGGRACGDGGRTGGGCLTTLPGARVESRDRQLQSVAAHFAPTLTAHYAAHLDRLLTLLDQDPTHLLDRLTATHPPTPAAEALISAQIHGAGLALLHAREDLGALRLTVPSDWTTATTPRAAADFWTAHLSLPSNALQPFADTTHRIAAAALALAEGALLTDLHDALRQTATQDRTALQGHLRHVYEIHGLLPHSAHHADLILANNVQQAAHTIRYEQTVANPAAIRQIPYLFWWTMADDRVRQRPLHNHAVMHFRVFAIDHPIWKTWWPPAGHNCRCGVGTLTVEEAQLLGLVGSEPTGPWPTAPGTGGPALPDPGFQRKPNLAATAEDLAAQAHQLRRDAATQGGDLLAAIDRLFNLLGLSSEAA